VGALSPLHLVVILVVALFIIGPGKLPDTGKALGSAIRDFRRAVDGKDDPLTGAESAGVESGEDQPA
jgi:sec-independent protein translocase protein TatA